MPTILIEGELCGSDCDRRVQAGNHRERRELHSTALSGPLPRSGGGPIGCIQLLGLRRRG